MTKKKIQIYEKNCKKNMISVCSFLCKKKRGIFSKKTANFGIVCV